MTPIRSLAWLLIVFLHATGTVSFAEEPKPSHETSTMEKASQGASIDNQPARLTKSARSKLPEPSQKMLDDVLSKLKSVRFIDCGLDYDGRRIEVFSERMLYKSGPDKYGRRTGVQTGRRIATSSGKVVFESSNPRDLKKLTEFLRIREECSEYVDDDPYVVQRGVPTLELTLVDGRKVDLGIIGGRLLRWKAWRHDACLMTNQIPFILWLAEHGSTRTAREVQAELDYVVELYEWNKGGFDEFVRLMPTSLRDFFGYIRWEEGGLETMSTKYGEIPEAKRLKLAKVALSRQFPNVSDQIGVLFEWSGKLTRTKRGFEDFPIDLVLEYDPRQVLSKVKGSSLSPAQWVGVSRYYSSYCFRRRFPSGYKPLDKKLSARIIKGVKATGKNELDLHDFEYAMRNW